ncbi:MAG TPA: PIG-L family deacetylase [Acidimicrobiales bacterium]|nr:PIG-L family deacetylase [Acidimicrobiales bacterium]
MATIVSFHAHPDDESIGTGGTLAKAAAEGHRVVVVVATRGEHGEAPDGLLDEGEELAERRVKETNEAAQILGVHRLEFLDYVDSGIMGAPTNDAARSFWRVDVDEAADRVAAILVDERADILTVYDARGVTGHPDHIQVHRVGTRAATRAGTVRVYEVTVNRDHVRALMERSATIGLSPPDGIDLQSLGVPAAEVTTTIDVSEFLSAKRRAMAAHASQVSETSVFLALPEPMFALLWGNEWFIARGNGPIREGTLFGGMGHTGPVC